MIIISFTKHKFLLHIFLKFLIMFLNTCSKINHSYFSYLAIEKNLDFGH